MANLHDDSMDYNGGRSENPGQTSTETQGFIAFTDIKT
jgi:hypothetical protein